MAAAVAKGNCDPFTSRELPCEAGDSITYAVNASNPTDFAEAIAFAKKKNIRLVIRNTGHELVIDSQSSKAVAYRALLLTFDGTNLSYLGKSTGRWALSVWTHHMKNTEYFPSYNSAYYNGPAIKFGAGVQVEEAYTAARTYEHLVVAGDCATVGVAGGYLQGLSHSLFFP